MAAHEVERHGRGGLQIFVAGQAGKPRRKPRHRPAEPFEIMQAMRHEIAQHAAAGVAQCFPIARAHARRIILHVPMHRKMAQRADLPVVEHFLGALPARDLMEIEIDHRRDPALVGRRQHGARVAERGGHRLFGEHRLAGVKRRDRDLRLRGGRHGDRHRVHFFVRDQRAPVAMGPWHARRARPLDGARRVASRQRHHLTAGVDAECRQ